MWQGIEDMILDAFVAHLKTRPVSHLSLHFDGVRVDRQRVLAEADGAPEADALKVLLTNLETTARVRTGYEIGVVQKKHDYLIDKIRGHPGRERRDIHIPPLLLEDGNCIPLAIAAVRQDHDNVVAALHGVALEAHTGSSAKARSYRCSMALSKVCLRASFDLGRLQDGHWVIHTESDGRAHCFGVTVGETGDHTIHDGYDRLVVAASEFMEMLDSALDRKTIVPFRVEAPTPGADPLSGGANAALDLCAGSRIFDHEMEDLLADSDPEAKSAGSDSGDEAEVRVHETLESLVRGEVRRYATRCSTMNLRTVMQEGRLRCALCPFRAVPCDRNARRNLTNHLRTFHAVSTSFGRIRTWIASGTKQCKVIQAMYDYDRSPSRILASVVFP